MKRISSLEKLNKILKKGAYFDTRKELSKIRKNFVRYLTLVLVLTAFFVLYTKVPRFLSKAETETLLPSQTNSLTNWQDVDIENVKETDSTYAVTNEKDSVLALEFTQLHECDNEIEQIGIYSYVFSSDPDYKVSLGIYNDLSGEIEEPSHEVENFSQHTITSEKKANGERWTCEDLDSIIATLTTHSDNEENTVPPEWMIDKIWIEVEYTLEQAIINQRSFRWQYSTDKASEALKADEPLNKVKIGEQVALRVQLDNTGSLDSLEKNYQLQYAQRGEKVCNSKSDWKEVTDSTPISYLNAPQENIDEPQTDTSRSCGYGNCTSFISGSWNAQLSSFLLPINSNTEIGFNLDTINAAPETSYCLRVVTNEDGEYIPLDGTYFSSPEISFAKKLESSFRKELKAKKLPEIKSEISDFQLTQIPNFELDYFELSDPTDPYIDGIIEGTRVFEAGKFKITANILESNGNDTEITPLITLAPDGHTYIELSSSGNIKPGKYKLNLTVEENDYATLELEQDFTWGVIAINTNKSIYQRGEEVYLLMTVLDDGGRTVCDASVDLEITTPDESKYYYSTNDGSIQKSDECGPNNVTYIPDFSTHFYQTNETGNYEMKITAVTPNGERNLIDKFKVQEYVDFDVERIGPVRIYPLAEYEMMMKIKPILDFSGVVTEAVPSSFEIFELKTKSLNNFRVEITQETKNLIWHVNWKAGDIYEIGYTFDAPDISPEFYLLGPLEIKYLKDYTFKESRSWQIASDDQETIRPDSTGNSAQWDYSSSSDYTDTSDQSDTTYIYTATSSEYDIMNLSASSFSDSDTINWVQTHFKCRSLNGSKGPEKIQAYIRTHDTNYEVLGVTGVDRTTFTQYDGSQETVNPNTLLAWTKTEVDALQAGVYSNAVDSGEEIRCSEVWVVVDYTLAPTNQAPNSPSILTQTQTDDTNIVVADWTDEASVKFTAQASDPDNPDTLYLCIEKDNLSTSFSDTEDSCGSGVAYSGSPVTVTHTISGLTQGEEYHWHARIKDSGDLYSSWVSFESNAEDDRDVGIDTSGPSSGTVYDGATIGSDVDENDGTLDTIFGNWSGIADSDSGIKQYEYAIGTTAGGTDIVNWTAKSEPGGTFSDSFESASLSSWDANQNDSGDLSATSDSSGEYIGLYGLSANIDDGNSIYVQDNFTSASDYYSRFYINPNNLTMASSDTFTIADIRSSTTIRASIELYYNGSNYQVRGVLETGPQTTSWVTIGATSWTSVELRWFADASGYVSIWVNGSQYDTATGNTNGLTVDNIALGMVSDRDAGTSGEFFLDHFTSDTSGYNGTFSYFEQAISTAGHMHTGQDYYISVRATNNAETTAGTTNSDGFTVLPTFSFSVSPGSINFLNLDEGNSWTDTKTTTTTVSTNAYNGYIATIWTTQDLTNTLYGSKTISNYGSPNSNPTPWTGTGFGYTTNDSELSGGTGNRFTNGGPNYAGFPHTGNGEPVCDHTANITGQTGALSSEQFTITYRVTVDAAQTSGPYETVIVYVATPTF